MGRAKRRAAPGLPRWTPLNSTHLHSEDEAVAVQWVLPVQKAVQGQRPADIVQSKDAVGVP